MQVSKCTRRSKSLWIKLLPLFRTENRTTRVHTNQPAWSTFHFVPYSERVRNKMKNQDTLIFSSHLTFHCMDCGSLLKTTKNDKCRLKFHHAQEKKSRLSQFCCGLLNKTSKLWLEIIDTRYFVLKRKTKTYWLVISA